ncbi:MAG: MFS transporter [Parvibaculaceae bacterium]
MGDEERSAAGGPVASRAGQFSWAFFDWANQPYFTLITTFIFAPYFAAGFVGDPVRGQALWGYTQSIAGLSIALASPLLGAIADQTGARKPWLLFFSVIFVTGASLLWFALPGAPGGTGFIMAAVVAAALGMEFALVFYNAMLPSLVPARRMGALSGFGWGIGYVGGLGALFFVLAFMVADAQSGRTMMGFEPLFGLDPVLREADRFTGPLAALWYTVFSLPLFLLTPDAARVRVGPRAAVAQGVAQLRSTLAKLPAFRNIGLFLVARMTYYDGLSAIFAFGGIYAAGTFGWEIQTLGVFGIILSVFAAVGAFLGGWMDDRVGSKRTILIAVAGLVAGTVASVSITADTVLFVIDVAPPVPGAAPFSSTAEQVYLLAGILIGISGGPAQAASRTLMARLAPPSMITEFFGLYALSGKATSFIAPFAIALATSAAASQRAGLYVIVGFLAAGFLLLLPVREEQAQA